MLERGDVLGLFLVWLAFMAVVVVYAARIGILVRTQRRAERLYRMRLAAEAGRAVREAASAAERQGWRNDRPG